MYQTETTIVLHNYSRISKVWVLLNVNHNVFIENSHSFGRFLCSPSGEISMVLFTKDYFQLHHCNWTIPKLACENLRCMKQSTFKITTKTAKIVNVHSKALWTKRYDKPLIKSNVFEQSKVEVKNRFTVDEETIIINSLLYFQENGTNLDWNCFIEL